MTVWVFDSLKHINVASGRPTSAYFAWQPKRPIADQSKSWIPRPTSDVDREVSGGVQSYNISRYVSYIRVSYVWLIGSTSVRGSLLCLLVCQGNVLEGRVSIT